MWTKLVPKIRVIQTSSRLFTSPNMAMERKGPLDAQFQHVQMWWWT